MDNIHIEPTLRLVPLFKKRNATAQPLRKRRRGEDDEDISHDSSDAPRERAQSTPFSDVPIQVDDDDPADNDQARTAVRRPESTDLTLQLPAAAVGGISTPYNRFVAPLDPAQTSWADDPHTLAYVERTLAERRKAEVPSVAGHNVASESTDVAATVTEQPGYWYKQKSSAAAGKLEEVNLGELNTERNIERTKIAVIQQLNAQPGTVSPFPPRRVFTKERKREEKRRARMSSAELDREARSERIKAEMDTYLAQDATIQTSTFARFQTPTSKFAAGPTGDATTNITTKGKEAKEEDRMREMFRRQYEYEQDRADREPVPEQRGRAAALAKERAARGSGEGDSGASANLGPKMGGSRNLRRAQAIKEEEARRRAIASNSSGSGSK